MPARGIKAVSLEMLGKRLEQAAILAIQVDASVDVVRMILEAEKKVNAAIRGKKLRKK